MPILFLSARDNTTDKIRGLTTGGDDYVTKPFSLEELMARLRNILRRSGAHDERSSRLAFADLELGDGGQPRGDGDRADGYRVPPAALSAAQLTTGDDPRAAARPRLEL